MLCKPFSIEPHWGKMWWSSLRFGQQRIELGNVNTSWYPLPHFVNPLTATLHPPPLFDHTHTHTLWVLCVRLICWVTHKFVSATNASTLTGPKVIGFVGGGLCWAFFGFPKDVWVVKLLWDTKLPLHPHNHLPPPTSHLPCAGKWSRALSIQCSLCCPRFIRSFCSSFVLVLSCFPCVFLCNFYAILNFGVCVRFAEKRICNVQRHLMVEYIFLSLFPFAGAKKCDSGILSKTASDLKCPGRLELCSLSLNRFLGSKCIKV